MSVAATGQLPLPPTKLKPSRTRADLALAFVALVWGTTFVVVKGALLGISTMYFLSLRFSVATVCMGILFAVPLRRAGLAAVRQGLLGGAIAGLFLWLGYVLQTFGLKYTSAGNSGFLTGLYIVMAPMIGAAVFRRRPQKAELIGLSMAVMGLVLMTAPARAWTGSGFDLNFGDLLTVGCALAFAVHLLVLGHYSKGDSFEAVAIGQIACAAVLSTVSLWLEAPHAVWSRSLAFAIILTSVLATAIAFALQTWGQRYTTATRTALIFSLEPVFAFVTAIAVGGEAFTWRAAAGGGLILAGVLFVELRAASAVVEERGHET